MGILILIHPIVIIVRMAAKISCFLKTGNNPFCLLSLMTEAKATYDIAG